MKNKLHVAWKQISNPFVLNLDPDFRPLEIKHPDYNVLEFKTSVFPGGEQHFQITNGEYPGDLIITQRYNSAADLMLIILANDAAKRMGFTNIQLVLPYFPGARQDRVCNTGEALTVKVFVDLINSCGFDRVFIYSPHSEVTPAVINNCEIIDLDSYYLEKILREQCPGQSDSIVNIVCPDAGAGKRVANLAKAMAKLYPQNTINLIRCEKVRDVASGELKEFFCASDDLGGFVTIIADHLGFNQVLTSTGQIYPRSLDFEVMSTLVQVLSGPSNLATSIRLMAGNELVTEGFKPGQVGSSAMPHKMNARSCERVNGFLVVLRGYLTMATGLAGVQWNEGDVSCSVVRRVALPDSFYAIDGAFETFLTILGDFGAFPAVIEAERERYLPFLTTTKVLMACVRAGVGREDAHEAIKEHAVAVALDMRETGRTGNDLFARLAADPRIPLTKEQLRGLVSSPLDLTGGAQDQVEALCAKVEDIVREYPKAANYLPGLVL